MHSLLTLILFLVTALQYEPEPLESSALLEFLLDTAAKNDEVKRTHVYLHTSMTLLTRGERWTVRGVAALAFCRGAR